ncbi:Uncharacterised protein [Bordetella pertussis]|nr:Uncharacterised protein [Bordetella pertussis]
MLSAKRCSALLAALRPCRMETGERMTMGPCASKSKV